MPPTFVPPAQQPQPVSDAYPVPSGNSTNVSYSTSSAMPPPANLSQVNTTAQASYFGYGCSIVYRWNTGRVPQPVAAGYSSQPVQMVRLNTGCGTKTITAVATCVGQIPAMPSFNTGSSNDVLLDMLIGSFSPEQMPDGTRIYGVVVQYVYALQQAPGPNDLLDMGSTPFDVAGAAANTLNPANFLQYLVGPASPVTPPSSSAASTLSGSVAQG